MFSSDAEVKQYGMRPEEELNGGESIEVRAQDGYYFKYRGACKVREIDGFPVNLSNKTSGSRAV